MSVSEKTHAETIADIVAEMRREADYIEETARGSLKAGENYDGIAYTETRKTPGDGDSAGASRAGRVT